MHEVRNLSQKSPTSALDFCEPYLVENTQTEFFGTYRANASSSAQPLMTIQCTAQTHGSYRDSWMSALLQEEIDRILGFLGYGNLAAPLWFIGLEEGIGGMGDSDVRHNLKARGQWAPVMDLPQSHMTLVQAGAPYDIRHRPSFTQVWTWISKFAQAYHGASNWDDLSAAKAYVRDRLGRSGGDVFMTYAMPIPESGLHTREWTDFLHRNGGSPNQALALRRFVLRALIEQHRPKIVICHGTTQTTAYQSLLPAANWNALAMAPQVITGTAVYGGRFFITPFFGNGQMSDRLAHAFARELRRPAPSPGLPMVSPGKHAQLERNAIPSAPNVPPIPVQVERLRVQEYGDGTDPKGTVRLLDDLRKIGLDDDAFWQLHHKKLKGERETIRGFHSYCLKTQSFKPDQNNWRVHQRLLTLLRACTANPAVNFSDLAQQAFRNMPPV